MVSSSIRNPLRAALVLLSALALFSTAWAQTAADANGNGSMTGQSLDDPDFRFPQGATGWNWSPDPYALYGRCLPDSIGAGMSSKIRHVYEVGKTAENILAITVLSCTGFSGPGNTRIIPCPSGSPYAFCTENDNDGAGNKIILGILKKNAITDPNGLYVGCPTGAQLRPKITLLKLARLNGRTSHLPPRPPRGSLDPRRINGIVTLSCAAATAPDFTPPTQARCPDRPHPYAYCLGTPNDGKGNAVTIGVVAANGADDPYALYGECDNQLDLYGIKPGFHTKSSLVEAVGRSLRDVRSIDLLGCTEPGGTNVPPDLEVTSCTTAHVGSIGGGHYDYCIWGTDALGNGLAAGVNQQ
jgi:hypothetical protein